MITTSLKSPSIFNLAAVLLLSTFTLPTRAGTVPDTNLFQWKFSNNELNFNLASCISLPITVQPVNATNQTHGIPPFYMVAWEIGGTPRTTLLGLNESSLSWTVDHPVGTTLMLNVVDSRGNGGGIPPQAYTVINGQSTSCIVQGNNTDFTVSANITDTVQTCQPWGLRIKGGSPPYNISFGQFNSPVVTNVTIQAPSDAFTYIDRATPDSLLLAAVSDVTGRWAFGTPTVMPKGSDDVDCVGLNSSPGNAAQLDQAQADQIAAAAKAKRKRTAVLAGVLTPLLVLLFGGLAVYGYHWYRKQRRETEEQSPDPLVYSPPKDMEEGNEGRRTSAFLDRPFSPSSNSRSLSPSSPPGLAHLDASSPTSQRTNLSHPTETYSSRPNSGSSRPGNGFARFPSTSVRQSAKAIEAGYVINRSPDSAGSSSASALAALSREHLSVERSQSATVAQSPKSVVLAPTRSASVGTTAVGQTISGEQELIIQHQDGGGVVRELPPPYADRSPNSESPTANS